jgi:ketosteroid isomerase-like protein
MHKQIKIIVASCLGAIATTLVTSLNNSASAAPINNPVNSSVNQSKANLAPQGLVKAIANLDGAASKQDLQRVMEFYPDSFKQGDGLTKQKLRESLEALWQKYKDIQYQTEIIKVEPKGDTYIVETMTKIRGTHGQGESQFKLVATLTSVQTYQNKGDNWQILRQDILTERSTLISGENPPTVELRLPQVIGIGRQYALDAIVTEPLEASLLLGAVVEEKVNASNFIKDVTIDLEALKSGGIFKIGQAPYNEGDRWISVVLVRENGISINSQRVRVSKDLVGGQYTPLPETGSIRIRVPSGPKKQTRIL